MYKYFHHTTVFSPHDSHTVVLFNFSILSLQYKNHGILPPCCRNIKHYSMPKDELEGWALKLFFTLRLSSWKCKEIKWRWMCIFSTLLQLCFSPIFMHISMGLPHGWNILAIYNCSKNKKKYKWKPWSHSHVSFSCFFFALGPSLKYF